MFVGLLLLLRNLVAVVVAPICTANPVSLFLSGHACPNFRRFAPLIVLAIVVIVVVVPVVVVVAIVVVATGARIVDIATVA